MIFLQLFWSFLKIGIMSFGGGYAMIALIHDEVVTRQQWLTPQEFTDLVAVSQMTPGPIGINTATYAGYTAVVNAGYSTPWAIAGSLLSSLAVVLLPILLMLLLVAWLLRHKDDPVVERMLRVMRLAVVGLIASAALSLVGRETFGEAGVNVRFLVSLAIFALTFVMILLAPRWEQSPRKVCRLLTPIARPIPLLLLSALTGLLVYTLVP